MLMLREKQPQYRAHAPISCTRCGVLTPYEQLGTDRRFRSGKKKICRRCLRDQARIYYSTEHGKAVHAAAERQRRRQRPERAIFHLAKQRAKRKGLEFDLTFEDIVIPAQCPVLGIPLVTGASKLNDNSPTLDRIDNTRGYTKDNVRVISWRANKLKGDATAEELRRVLAYIEENR